MNKKKGTVCMSIGALLLLAAMLLTIFNIIEAKNAERASKKVLPELEETIQSAREHLWEEEMNPDREMPTVEIDGYRYIGILEIEAIDLTLPVMEEWDYTRLKIAPCRYAGSIYQDNMIIAGHNYAKHFSPIKNLPQGTEICFTDVEGNEFHYTLEWIDVLEGNQTEQMLEGDWDLSLFTCTYGGGSRYVLRCSRNEEK